MSGLRDMLPPRDPAGPENPYDALDDAVPDGPFLTVAQRPGLAERFAMNFEAGARYGTLGKAVQDHATEFRRRERARFDARYESFPQWETPLEGLAALGGQLAGAGTGIENYVPIGWGARITQGIGWGTSALRARLLAGAVDAGATNVIIDSGIQGIEIAGGSREAFSPGQLAASTALGSVAGAAFGAVAGRRAGGSENPYDALDAEPLANRSAAPEIRALAPPEAGQGNQPPPLPPRPVADALPPPPEAAPIRLRDETADGSVITGQAPEDIAIGDRLEQQARQARNRHLANTEPNWRELIDPTAPRTDMSDVRAALEPDGFAAHYAKLSEQYRSSVEKQIDEYKSDLKYYEDGGNNSTGPSGVDYSPPFVGFDDTVRYPSKKARSQAISAAIIGNIKENLARLEAQKASGLNRDEALSFYKLNQRNIAADETATADGRTQAVIEGAGPASQRALAQRAADAPLRASKPQDLSLDHGLFGDGHLQDELFSTQGANAGTPRRAAAGTLSNVTGQRLTDITKRLSDRLGLASVRQGRLPQKRNLKVMGTYDPKDGGIRTRLADDFDTFTHEAGHHVENAVPGTAGLMSNHAAELEPLAYAGAASNARLKEGFAEFFRWYITNPGHARKQAPRFFAAFDDHLARADADMHAGVIEARDAYRQWLTQPSDAAVASTIVSQRRSGFAGTMRAEAKRRGWSATIADVLHGAYGAVLDTKHPLARAVRGLAAIHEANTGRKLDLRTADNPYRIARMAKGAGSQGHVDIMHGVHGYRRFQPETASLRDAIVEAIGAANVFSRWKDEAIRDFGAYLWSRRALGEWNRFDTGQIPDPPDKLTRGDHELNVRMLEGRYPAFRSAAAKAHDFARGLWTKKFEAGLITREQHDAGLAIQDYVPGLRSFDQDGDPAGKGGGRGQSARAGFVRRFKGSRRDVINPLESLMADAYETASAIARNDAIKALARLSRTAGPGAAAIAEEIPVTQLQRTLVDPLEAVEAAARQAGLAHADAVTLRDAFETAVGPDSVALFRPATITENGEPIAFWRDGGELRALRLADGAFGRQMVAALTSMSPQESNLLIELLSKPAALLRAGITTSLDFLMANFLRDQTMAWLFYGSPLKRTAATAAGMADEVFASDAARAYNAAGGLSGGASTAALRQGIAERDIKALKLKGWGAQRLTSLKGVLRVSELSETGVRLGLFRTFREEAKARGLDDYEAAMEASWQARDYIDFDRSGWLLAPVARIVPFLNVAVQGIDKTTRHTLAPFARKMAGADTLAEDGAALGTAAKTWARAMVLGVLGLSLHAVLRRSAWRDEIDDASQTRATHWLIPMGGKLIAVPKPFEFAAMLNLFEAAYDAYAESDPLAAERYMDGLARAVAPPNAIEGNPALRWYFENKTNEDFFTGRAIVPDHLQGLEPWLQYTGRTAEFARQFGELTGTSPLEVEHAIVGFGGSWGRNLLAMYDWAASDKPAPGWDDAPVLRRFIKDASRGSSSSRAFWDLIGSRTGRLEGAAQSYRAMVDAGDEARAADWLATQERPVKDFVTVAMMNADARRLHPLLRARAAVQAIGALRREIAGPEFTAADGSRQPMTGQDRRAADDILSRLAMAEARNGLVLTGGIEGFAPPARDLLPVDGWRRELEALNPELARALGARFAAGKVLTPQAVARYWPELRDRARAEGSAAVVADLTELAKADGWYWQGEKGAPGARRGKPVIAPLP